MRIELALALVLSSLTACHAPTADLPSPARTGGGEADRSTRARVDPEVARCLGEPWVTHGMMRIVDGGRVSAIPVRGPSLPPRPEGASWSFQLAEGYRQSGIGDEPVELSAEGWAWLRLDAVRSEALRALLGHRIGPDVNESVEARVLPLDESAEPRPVRLPACLALRPGRYRIVASTTDADSGLRAEQTVDALEGRATFVELPLEPPPQD